MKLFVEAPTVPIEPEVTDVGTMIQHATLTNSDKSKHVDAAATGSVVTGSSGIEVDLGTMVINEDNDNTIQRPRPEFLDHFDQKEKVKSFEKSNDSSDNSDNLVHKQHLPPSYETAQAFQNQFQQTLGGPGQATALQTEDETGASSSYNSAKFQQYISEGNLEFIKYLSTNELLEKMNNLDAEMEREIDDLRRRYHTKRQPILDAKDQKRKSQQNF